MWNLDVFGNVISSQDGKLKTQNQWKKVKSWYLAVLQKSENLVNVKNPYFKTTKDIKSEGLLSKNTRSQPDFIGRKPWIS